jgi:hypothetical protein
MQAITTNRLTQFDGGNDASIQRVANDNAPTNHHYFKVENAEGEYTIVITAPTTARVLIELIRAKDRGITKGDVFGITKCLVSQIKELKKYGLNIKSLGGVRQYGYDHRYVLMDKVMRKRKH